MARIRTVFADKGYDAEHHRDLCRRFGAEPSTHKRGRPRGSGLGKRRWPVERSLAWVLENRRLALRYDRLGSIVQSYGIRLISATAITAHGGGRSALLSRSAGSGITAPGRLHIPGCRAARARIVKTVS